MKKYTAILLAAMMVITMGGCSASDSMSSSFGAHSDTGAADSSSYAGGVSEGGHSSDSSSSMAEVVSSSPSAPVSGGDSSAIGTSPSTTAAAATEGTAAVENKAEALPAEPEFTMAESAAEAAPEAPAGDIADSSVFDAEAEEYWEADAVDGAMMDVGEGAMIDGDYSIDPPDFIEEPVIQPEAGLLTGGEWNDNDHRNDWTSLYQTHEDWQYYREEWDSDHDVRHEVTVTAGGKPVEGAKVVNAEGEGVSSAVTDNEGRAYLYIDRSDETAAEIQVTYGEVTVPITDVDMTKDGSYTIDFGEAEARKPQVLDLMLMIDTTGSMWDELAYIQEELRDVIERVRKDNANITVRVSVNFYRDEYDEYVIREFDFTEDIDSVIADIMAQEAEGGGDFPEAVHTAMTSAVKNHSWSENSTKLMFFVLDAPPHSDNQQIVDEVNDRIEDAAEMGIRIIPVASSGIDKTTEYLLRTMAFSTGGTYTFLTNDSGIGGDHIEPTIGDYEVEKLNDMMVRIINDYLK